MNYNRGESYLASDYRSLALSEPLVRHPMADDRYPGGLEDEPEPRQKPLLPIEKLLATITPTRKNEYLQSNWFARLFFSWVSPLFSVGNKRTLQANDLFEILDSAKIRGQGAKLKKAVESPENRGKPIVQVAFELPRGQYVKATLVFIAASLLQVAAPLLFNIYYKKLTDEEFESTLGEDHRTDESEDKKLTWAAAMVVCLGLDLFVRSVVLNKAFFCLAVTGAQIAVPLRQCIFNKMVNMNIVHVDYFAETTLVNLLTIDVEHLVSGLSIMPSFLGAGIVLVSQFYFLYSLGYLTLALGGFLLFAVYVLYLINKMTKYHRARLTGLHDESSSVMKDMVANIESVKTNRFEQVLYRKLMRHKEKESAIFKRYLQWTQVSSVLNFILPTLFGLVFFGLNILFKHRDSPISISETYLVLTVLSIMREPLVFIGEGFERYPEYIVSRMRIESFLKNVSERPLPKKDPSNLPRGSVCLQGCSFGFHPVRRDNGKSSGQAKDLPSLVKNINFKVAPGQKVALVGPAGSGKTFFMQSLAGETKVTSGVFEISGSVYYMPEQGYFTEDSIAQNIVCGQPYDEARFDYVLEVCKLEVVRSKLHHGCGLILKDNAANLYPKLRKRICLARALYAAPSYDVLLVDGSLDEMDGDNRSYFVDHYLLEALHDKTVVMCTDRVDLCKSIGLVAVLKEGSIVQIGTFKSLMRDEAGLFRTIMATERDEFADQEEPAEPIRKPAAKKRELFKESLIEDGPERPMHRESTGAFLLDKIESNDYSKIRAEKRDWTLVFNRFFFNYGYFLPITYAVLTAVSQLLTYGFVWFVAQWKAKAFDLEATQYLYLYAGVTGAVFVALVSTGLVYIKYVRKVSFKLYLYIARRLAISDLQWFRSMPASKMLNIFVNDYHSVDENMGPSLNSFLQTFIRLNVGLCILLYRAYFSGIPLLIVHVMLLRLLKNYLSPARCLSSIMVKNRAHLITTVMDCHRGLLHYRSSPALLSYVTRNFEAIHDVYHNSKSTDSSLGIRWLASRVQALVILYPVFVMAEQVCQKYLANEPDPVMLAVQFSVALDICFSAVTLVQSYGESESLVSSIETIIQKSNPQDTEVVREIKKDLTAAKKVGGMIEKLMSREDVDMVDNPEGDVVVDFENVAIPYPRMDVLALKGISFKVFAKEKVALVGKSGSGKHTILSMVAGLNPTFGMVQGKISVLGLSKAHDILEHHGGRLYYLSGDFHPVDGSLLTNIDPLRQYATDKILQILDYLRFLETPASYMNEKREQLAKINEVKAVEVILAEDPKTSVVHQRSVKLSFHREDSIFKDSHRSPDRKELLKQAAANDARVSATLASVKKNASRTVVAKSLGKPRSPPPTAEVVFSKDDMASNKKSAELLADVYSDTPARRLAVKHAKPGEKVQKKAADKIVEEETFRWRHMSCLEVVEQLLADKAADLAEERGAFSLKLERLDQTDESTPVWQDEELQRQLLYNEANKDFWFFE